MIGLYKAGGFNFPTVTGDYAVTGLGFQPQAVVMFGGNRPEVGSLVTGLSGPGLFMSLNALDWSDGTTVRSLTLSPNGKSDSNISNFRGAEMPVSMQTDSSSAATIDYRADSITFDADGFTLHVTHAATGVRPIHWLSWGTGPDGQIVATGAVKQQMSANTFTTSFQGLSTLVLSTIASDGFGEGHVDGACWFSWGSGHYPEQATQVTDWQSSTVYTQRQSASALGIQGFTHTYVWTNETVMDNLNVSNVINALGPVLVEGFRRHRPETFGSKMMNNNGGATGSYQYAVWWNGEGWCDFVSTDQDISDVVTVNHPANFEQFAAVLFSTINGAGSSGNDTHQRFGFGLLSDDYQGCVVFGSDGSFYQSTTECVATCTAGAVQAASGEIGSGQFSLTTTKGGASEFVVWHGFGAGPVRFLPQIYRRYY